MDTHKAAECTVRMMQEGAKAVPKSCAKCGLGPCPIFTGEKAKVIRSDWSAGVLYRPAPPVDIRRAEEALRKQNPLHNTCTVAPAGWQCTRNGGHSGPCAAVPEENALRDAVGQAISDYMREFIDEGDTNPGIDWCDSYECGKLAMKCIEAYERAKAGEPHAI